jgi:hypothetical protein
MQYLVALCFSSMCFSSLPSYVTSCSLYNIGTLFYEDRPWTQEFLNANHKLTGRKLRPVSYLRARRPPNFIDRTCEIFKPFELSGHSRGKRHTRAQQGCQIFLGAKYQIGEKYTKLPQTIPNVHKT